MRRLGLLPLVAVTLAGCGGGSKSTSTTTTQPDPATAMKALSATHPELRGTVRVLYDTGEWAIVESSNGKTAHAVVFRSGADGKWVADRAGKVKVDILGPQPGATAPRLPQIAIGIVSKLPFVDTALWVDGKELIAKGGGSPTRGTIYGAPERSLKPGTHIAVGYARNIVNGTAVAWLFKTR